MQSQIYLTNLEIMEIYFLIKRAEHNFKPEVVDKFRHLSHDVVKRAKEDGRPVEIPLTKGEKALVDPDNFTLIEPYRWLLNDHGSCKYAYTCIRTAPDKTKTIMMHRLIMQQKLKQKAVENLHIDHIDGSGLNNQEENLRLATCFQNMLNSSRHKPKIKFDHLLKGYSVSILIRKGIRALVGIFPTKEEAQRHYYRMSVHVHGDYILIPDEYKKKE